MNRKGLRRDRWRAEVLKSTRIPDSVRVVLLVLADVMTDAGYVSMPRSKIAQTINRSQKRVADRLKHAREAGYLDVVRAGKPGRTAEYAATLPDLSAGAHGCAKPGVRTGAPQHGADSRTFIVRTGAPTKPDAHGAHGGHTNTRASTTATEERTDAKSNDGTCTVCGSPSRYETCTECYALAIARNRKATA